MKQVTIGVGDLFVTRDPSVQLVTYALGTCIGVTLYDPVAGVGGMLHFLLPKSSINKERALRQPGVFCDTGFRLLMKKTRSLGAEDRRLIIKLAGGAKIINNGVTDIGKNNYMMIRKCLWKLNLMVTSEHVGGTLSRTLKMDVKNGFVGLHMPGNPQREL